MLILVQVKNSFKDSDKDAEASDDQVHIRKFQRGKEGNQAAARISISLMRLKVRCAALAFAVVPADLIFEAIENQVAGGLRRSFGHRHIFQASVEESGDDVPLNSAASAWRRRSRPALTTPPQ